MSVSVLKPIPCIRSSNFYQVQFCYLIQKLVRLLYRGSYISAHVLFNLLNELEEKIRCEALPSMLSDFPNDFNIFNNTGA